LKLLHLNIRSLVNKIDALEIELAGMQDEVDILCITEHWIPKALENTVVVNNYKPVAMFSRQSKKGGGVGIYLNVNTNFKYISRLDIDQRAIEGKLEVCAIELIAPNKLILIGCYRPPNSNVNEFLEHIVQLLESVGVNKSIICCGDFNLDLNDKNSGNAFKEAVALVNCKILNLEPTRIMKTKSGASSTVIDNVITNSTEVSFIKNLDLGLADHLAQLVYIKRDVPIIIVNNNKEVTKVSKRSFKSSNVDRFLSLLSEVNWEAIVNSNEVNAAFDIFIHEFNKCFDSAFPCLRVRNREGRSQRNKVWYTPELLNRSREVSYLYQMSRATGKLVDNLSYTKIQKLYALEIKAAVKSYNSKIIANSSNKSKAAWSVI
jgi:exonuclease III